MIDLEQAEILCKRMRVDHTKSICSSRDWNEILGAEHQALKWFPQIVSKLRECRALVAELRETRQIVSELRAARDRIRELESKLVEL